MSIEDKLRETFKLVLAGHLNISDAVGISKQAFTDEGYTNSHLGDCMSGWEWYERFEKELDEASKRKYADEIDYSLVAVHNLGVLIMKAAKRAAGLSDE